MLKITPSNIFGLNVELRVVPVNTQGTMGAGLAKSFAERYPELENAYKEACLTKRLTGTSSLLYRAEFGPHVLCVPTKENWRHRSTIERIDICLDLIVRCVDRNGYKNIAVPALGCGLGGLHLDEILDMLIERLHPHPSNFLLSTYGQPSSTMFNHKDVLSIEVLGPNLIISMLWSEKLDAKLKLMTSSRQYYVFNTGYHSHLVRIDSIRAYAEPGGPLKVELKCTELGLPSHEDGFYFTSSE